MRAYDESLVSSAKKHLSVAFDYAVHDCKQDIDTFAELFLASGIAELFEEGNPAVIDGMSGPELGRAILSYQYGNTEFPACTTNARRSPEYWVGWALAQYQQQSARRFKHIFRVVPASEMVLMYRAFHEMDIEHFYREMDARIEDAKTSSRLQEMRLARGLSQSQLADAADVGLRNIQLYEQGVNSIDRAQARTVYRLARVLGCRMEDLLEDPTC